MTVSPTARWKGRCLNVHPSLLPKHAGLMDLAVHEAVLAAGDAESGCTVHLVDEVRARHRLSDFSRVQSRFNL